MAEALLTACSLHVSAETTQALRNEFDTILATHRQKGTDHALTH